MNNIILSNNYPIWHHNCEQCLACFHWCPKEAIQYGEKTAERARYHHPDIKLTDIIARNG
jgi:MinD superfamily P-loop ATPase